jgi:hypothetical protein
MSCVCGAGTQVGLPASFPQESEEEETESEEESSEQENEQKVAYVCGFRLSRGRGECKKPVRGMGVRCYQHPKAGTRTASGPVRGKKRAATNTHITSPDPKKHSSAVAAISTAMSEFEGAKKLLELTKSMAASMQPTEKHVSGHDVHDFHMDMIRALRSPNPHTMGGMSGGFGAPFGHNMTMGESSMQRELSPLTQSVRSLLTDLGLAHLGENIRKEGVNEVADLWDLTDEELESLGLKPMEKKRYHRMIPSLKARYE